MTTEKAEEKTWSSDTDEPYKGIRIEKRFTTEDGKLYVFFRSKYGKRLWYKVSEDNGKTFSSKHKAKEAPS